MKRVMGYEVDGKIYYDKAEAEKANAVSGLADFFASTGAVDLDTAQSLVCSLLGDDLDRFAEIIRPLIRKPRAAKAEATADEYEATMGELRSTLSDAISEDVAAYKATKKGKAA